MEASWVSGVTTLYTTRIPPSSIPDAIKSKFKQFLTIIRDLETRGIVEFGNQEITLQSRLRMWVEYSEAYNITSKDPVTPAISYPKGAFVWYGGQYSGRLVTIKTPGEDRVEITWFDPYDGRLNYWVDVSELQPFQG